MRRSLSIAGAAGIALTIAACGPGSPRPSLKENPTVTHRLSEEATGIDRSVEMQVQRRLNDDRRLGSYDIRVAATERGVVTLYGTVPTEADRVLAARVASDVSGVKRIDNELAIRVPSPDIRHETY
jgi:hyperosmotically inducible protein